MRQRLRQSRLHLRTPLALSNKLLAGGLHPHTSFGSEPTGSAAPMSATASEPWCGHGHAEDLHPDASQLWEDWAADAPPLPLHEHVQGHLKAAFANTDRG